MGKNSTPRKEGVAQGTFFLLFMFKLCRTSNWLHRCDDVVTNITVANFKAHIPNIHALNSDIRIQYEYTQKQCVGVAIEAMDI